MANHGDVIDTLLPQPASEHRFRRPLGLRTSLREAWGARELTWRLAQRELRARYKQAVLGFGWAVFTPIVLAITFTLVFRRVATIDTSGAPYLLFAYIGLLPWTFFSSSVSSGSVSLIANAQVLNKVYCPREVFPVAAVVVSAIDTCFSTVVLGAFFVVTAYPPRLTSIWVPLILVVQLCFTVGVVLLLSSLLVFVRDLRHLIPIVLQVGLLATPVAYPLSAVPSAARLPYTIVNPLGEIIDAYRRTVLVGASPEWPLFAAATASSLVLAIAGYAIFRRLELMVADVA